MSQAGYLDFDLLIERSMQEYRVKVLDSPVGPVSGRFVPPFSELELENFFLRIGRPRQGVRRLESPEMEAARDFGSRLFEAAFDDEVRAYLRSSLNEATRRDMGLRIRLHLTGVPELVNLPWEYLYDPTLERFFVLSVETPIVRYLELPHPVRPLAVQSPLKVLAMIASPTDYPPLDVDREWAKLHDALGELGQRGLVTVDRLEAATLSALQDQLRHGQYHIFHFVGHGGFDERAQDGVLMMEDEQGRGREISGRYLGTLLHDHRALRLAILNACEGARASRSDPFAGTAQSLVQQGIPAVIAMQFEITDKAAITLSHEFYAALADGYLVDAALAEARKAIFAHGNDIEWGTPVLYLRSLDGRVFDVERMSQQEQRDALLASARSAEAQEDWAAVTRDLEAVLDLQPAHAEATERLERARQQLEAALAGKGSPGLSFRLGRRAWVILVAVLCTLALGIGGYLAGRNWIAPPATPTSEVRSMASMPLVADGIAVRSFSLFEEANRDSLIVARPSAGTAVSVLGSNDDGTWLHVRTGDGEEGWVIAQDLAIATPTPERRATPIAVGRGFGARTDAWQLFFTAPQEDAASRASFGIDVRLADAIGRAERTLDIAAFEFDNRILTEAVLEAQRRGIQVRVVTDDEHGLGSSGTTLGQLAEAGVPIVTDKSASLMGDKFVLLDGQIVWTGSWNYAETSTYKSNENALVFESVEVAMLYQAEFDEMFERNKFGHNSPSGDVHRVTVSGVPVEVYFAPEEDVLQVLLDLVTASQSSVRFMVFSFTVDELGEAMRAKVAQGIHVQGIFETAGSGTEYSEFTGLFCAGADVRQDGNPYALHHKTLVIDDQIVVTGSLDFSSNAVKSNDENVVVVRDPVLAAEYAREFARLWEIANAPTGIQCGN